MINLNCINYIAEKNLVRPVRLVLESETIESSHWLLTKRLHFRTKFPNLYYLFKQF